MHYVVWWHMKLIPVVAVTSITASAILFASGRAAAETVLSDTFNYTATNAFLAEGGWTSWTGGGGSDAGSGICWGQSIVLEYNHLDALTAGETVTMNAVLGRPWGGYQYGMRVILWDGTDSGTWTEVAGGTFQGNSGSGGALPEVSYTVTPGNITDGLTHVIFRYSHDGNWGETQEVAFAINPLPTGWTWQNADGGSWGTPANWSPAGPADGADMAALANLLDITGDQTITLDGSYTIGSLHFADAAGQDGNWILDPGTGGTLALSAPDSGPPGVVVSSQTATINVVLNGTEGMTKSGMGTLVLGATNTYTGDTTVASGTLRVANSAAIPSGTGAGNLSLGGTLDLNDTSITINGLTGGGTVTNSGSGPATLTIGGGDADGLSFAGAINNGSGTTSLEKIGAGTLTLTGIHGLSGSITGNQGTLVIGGGFNRLHNVASVAVGQGAAVELNGGNMFVPGHGSALAPERVLTTNGGTLHFNTAMESRIGNVNLANGATWRIDRGLAAWDVLLGNTTDGPATVTVANTGGSTAPSTLEGFGGLHLQGVQNFDIDNVTGDEQDDFIVSIPLANPGNSGGAAGGVNKLGSGTMRLVVRNQYTGDTIVSEGTLVLEEFAVLRFVIGANGVNNRISGPGTAFLDGDFEFDFNAADTTNGNQWVIVDTANFSFGPGFYIPAFDDEADGVHTLADGDLTWSFNEATGILSVESSVAPEGYANWAAENAPAGTPDDDFDGDGVPNAIEWVLGGSKDTNDLDKLPQSNTVGGNFVFSFVRNDAAWASGDTTVEIEVGTDLTTWPDTYAVPQAPGVYGPVTVAEDGGTTTVTLTIPTTPDAAKFARLRATVTP